MGREYVHCSTCSVHVHNLGYIHYFSMQACRCNQWLAWECLGIASSHPKT